MTWFRKRRARIDPEVMDKQATESLEQTSGNQDKVNVLTKYLNNREGQNGFGEDFEITFHPREAT